MHGAGNDFIMIDNRQRRLRNVNALARKLCQIHIGVGADGVILIEKSKKSTFKMRIINADGGEAEMCGNGARCAVSFAKYLGIFKNGRVSFETLSGIFFGEETKRGFRIFMTDPTSLKTPINLEIDGSTESLHFLNTGVPHTVRFVRDVNKIAVVEIGRTIRQHPYFKPAGTNVNFVEVQGRNRIAIRTYERGVEDETLACGTGSVAASCLSYLIHNLKTPLEVKTKSGKSLFIDFEYSVKDRRFHNVTMEGDANVVYNANLVL